MIVAYDAKRVFHNFTGIGNYSRSTLDMLEKFHPEVETLLLASSVGRENPRTARFVPRAVLPNGLLRGSVWRTLGMGIRASRPMQPIGGEGAVCADLFHGLSHELPTGLDIPSVSTMHDVAFRTFKDMYSAAERLIYDMKWRYACKHATHIVAISQYTKQDVQRFYGVEEERISVVYQPVSDCFYGEMKRRKAEREPYLLYVGTINSRKNLLAIVQAIEMLPEAQRIPLWVVGDGSGYKRKVMEYVERHGLGRWVVMKGRAETPQELKTLYEGATAFIYPSHFEGMGLPVIEAQLCGCPVITSNVTSLPEAGGDAAIQVPPTDTRALADAIDRVSCDAELAARMSQAGRERCMNTFHPSVLADQLIAVYNKALN